MIQALNVCLSFGDQIVFDDVSFTINQHQRIGLVGRNGSGKSTLLKAIAHQQHLDEGVIATSNKKVVAYMPQEVVLESNKSILEETLTAFETLHALEQESIALELALDNDPTHEQLERYAEVQAELADLSPAAARAKTQKILAGLGFEEAHLDKQVNTLSVGWKMRIVLAKLLLKNADFYLFDEPTNHLDIIAKDWFLEFLRNASFGFMLVSHEKYFLDMLCTEILELEFGKATFYSGNYSKYVVQKEHDLEILHNSYEQQQRELKQKMATVERFRAKASKAGMAQSMLKAIDKIERITIPPSPKTVAFNFPPIVQSGRIPLEIDNVGYSFGEKHIFSGASFQVERGEKIAIIAANGVGKTTLFNVIIGKLKAQTGTITFGYNVHPTIFAQDQTQSLDVNKTIIENITERSPKKTEQAIRSFLGAFLFSKDDIHKKVKVLSGGEKNRVGMVSVLLQDANLLLLDEPTNHLDIPSKEILLNALQAFKGTILFVSHDHDFINSLATRIIELTPQGTNSYIGNYEAYLYQKKVNQQREKSEAKEKQTNQKKAEAASHAVQQEELDQAAKNEPKALNYEQAKLLKKLENKIEKIEKEIKTQEQTFVEYIYGTTAFDSAHAKLQTLKQEHQKLLAEWEELQNK